MVRFTILLLYSSDLGLAFQVKYYGALKLYTIAYEPADDFPAAARCLKSAKFRLI
jgi:hypothetical protein